MTEQLNIHQRIHAIMEDVKYIKKEEKGGLEYNYVKHDEVTAKLRESFVKHGVLAIPHLSESEIKHFNATSWNWKEKKEVTKTVYLATVKMDVDFINIDKPEEKLNTSGWSGMGLDTQDKAIGKATSYAYKYCLLKTFALETGDEDIEEDQKTEFVKINIDDDLRLEANETYVGQKKEQLIDCSNLDELQNCWGDATKHGSWKKLSDIQRKELTLVKDEVKKMLMEFDAPAEGVTQ